MYNLNLFRKKSNQNAANIIEDCHVMTDNSSYGDWLIEQGLVSPVKICKNGDNANEDPMDKEPVNVEPTKPKVELPQATGDEIHKILDSVVVPAPSDSLNDLIDKFNKYIGPQTVPDCESKINRLKEILNILDSDVKQTEPKTENTQKDGEIKKRQDIDKEKNSDKEPQKEGDKQKDNHKNNAEEPKVKVDDPQKSQEDGLEHKTGNEHKR